MRGRLMVIGSIASFATILLFAGAACKNGGDSLRTLPAYSYSRCSPPESVTSSLDLSSAGGKAKVYALDPAEIDESYAADLARRFGIDASPVYETKGSLSGFTAEDGAASMFIEATTGSVHYGLSTALGGQGDEGQVSDDDALKTAEKFLREKDLYPQSAMKAAVTRRSTNIEVSLEPADIPLYSTASGERIVVTLSTDGEVWGLIYQWREPEAIGEYPIVSEVDALDRLRNCRVIFASPSSDIDIANIELVYLGVPIEGPLEYLIPVYKLTDADQDTAQRQLAVVPAVTDEYLETQGPSATPIEGAQP